MKNNLGAIIFLTFCLLLAACNQSSNPTSPSSQLPIAITPPRRSVTPSPSVTVTSSIDSAQTSTHFPSTLVPSIEPTLIPGLLRNSFTIEKLDGLNGHTLRKITGWNYGFYPSSFCGRPEWLGSDHLLLFPRVGQEEGMGIRELTRPIVIEKNTGEVWLPPIPDNLFERTCPTYNFIWSETLGVMVMSENGNLGTYTPDGHLLRSFGYYPDEFGLILAPSGTKAMLGTLWTDLETGKMLKIRSQERIGFSAWSSDETQLFACCYYYGNVNTNQGYRFEVMNRLHPAGRDDPSFRGFTSVWIQNDNYVLVNYDFNADIFVDIPFIDPVSMTYKDIHDLTDIPKENYCYGRFNISPDKEYLWTHCGKQGYLITLANFTTQSFGDFWLTSWSKGSQFALIGEYNSEQQQILSISNRELKPLPSKSIIRTLAWHPVDEILAYLEKEGFKLITVDVQSWTSQEIKLSAKFLDLVWSRTGEHIALIAEDGGVSQVDYPTLKNLEQLTPALRNVSNIKWSPEDAYIAFFSGTDIYIVDTAR